MKGLVGCEQSLVVRNAFRKKGHDFYACDILLPETGEDEYFINDDIFHTLCSAKFSVSLDLFIGHPPCTYLCNSGVRWLYNKDGSRNKERWDKMENAASFFKALLNTNSKMVCIENPIMHKYALEIIGVRPTQIIQPWQFGHGETKATCLWLKNLPPLKPSNIVDGREQRIWKLPPGKDRWKERSKTFQGIADAMATQWSNIREYKQLELIVN